jgi:hypothetical protein
MGYIEEHDNVDLVIAGGELTAKDRKLLSALIKKERAAKSRPAAKRGLRKSGIHLPTSNSPHEA